MPCTQREFIWFREPIPVALLATTLEPRESILISARASGFHFRIGLRFCVALFFYLIRFGEAGMRGDICGAKISDCIAVSWLSVGESELFVFKYRRDRGQSLRFLLIYDFDNSRFNEFQQAWISWLSFYPCCKIFSSPQELPRYTYMNPMNLCSPYNN